MPPDLWRVIYFARIAAALRSGARISDLSPGEMTHGFQWTLGRSWVEDGTVRQLVGDAMQLIVN